MEKCKAQKLGRKIKRLRVETKGADSAEGRNKMHEGKIKCEGRQEKLKVQMVPRGEIKCMTVIIQCEWESRGSRGKIKGTKAKKEGEDKERNKRCR